MKKLFTILFLFAITLNADIIMKPYLMSVTKTSVYVLVECNSTSDVEVRYGTTDSYGSSATTESYLETSSFTDGHSNGHTYVHKIKLTGLSPATEYHYKAKQGSSEPYLDSYFKTAPEIGASFRFAWEADMRNDVGSGYDGTDEHNAIAGLIKNADAPPLFLLQGGDVCQYPTYIGYKNEFFLTNELNLISHVPFFWTPGPDHDIANSDDNEDVITDDQNFKAFSTSPDNYSNQTCYYYSFDYGDLHVLVLNNLYPDDIGSAQYNFAMNDLSTSTQKWKIVISHRAAYVGRQDCPECPDEDLINMTKNIFVPKGVDLVITGHHHFYQHNYVDGLHHVIIGTAGAPQNGYNPKAPPENYTIMSEKNFCYGIFDLTPNSLTMTSYRYLHTDPPTDPTVIEELTLTKTDNWTAYNDLAWGSGQLEPNLPSTTRKYITRITSPNGGSGLLNSGYLMDYTNGTFTSVKLTVTGGSFDGNSAGGQASHGQETPSGDAAIFNGKISPRGAVSYDNNNLELTLSGLNPAKLYEVVFYADRGDYGWIRASRVTLNGAISFINQSSTAIPPDPSLFSGPSSDFTKLPANNPNGYVARFTNIDPGDDIIKLIVSFDGTDSESRGKYASALMVEELSGETHNLTVDIWGQGSVTRNPDQAEYNDGQNVQLTPSASSGWQFLGWHQDLSGYANPGNITMNSDKTVRAIFKPIPNWTAYNDLAWGTDQLTTNITIFTSPNGQEGNDNDNDGELLKYIGGLGTGVNLNIKGGYYDRTSAQATHGRTPANGDGVILKDKVNTLGSISYDNPPLVLTFTGLYNDKYYLIGFYGDRNWYTWERASNITISGVVSFDNISSYGRDNAGNLICDGIADVCTKLPSDNDPGYMARFANIRAGDGVVVLTISPCGTQGNYANALLVEEYEIKLEPVPVELSTFIASIHGRNVNLIWQTATEVNSYGFEIERRLTQTLSNPPEADRGEGFNEWVKVGFVQGSGNSNSPKEYSFVDKKLITGKYNYRLKMIDNDGTFEYSDIVQVEIGLPREYAISQNYPNPFNPSTRIDYQLPFDSKVMIELYGITGERVTTLTDEELAAGYYTSDINANVLSLASGVYFCRMVAQDLSKQSTKTFIQIKKLMLLK